MPTEAHLDRATEPRPRRVVLVSNGLTHGGAETQTVRLAEALVRHGDEVAVVSIMPSLAYEEHLAALGIPVMHLDPSPRARALSSMTSAVSMLRGLRPDVVVSFVYQANILARIAGTLAGVPVIVSSIRNERFGGPRRERLVAATDRFATVTTTNSRRAADRLTSQGIVPAARLRVIGNAVDAARFDAAAPRSATRAALGLSDDAFVWACVGRLEEQKDHATLIRAMVDVPRAELLVIGQGPLEEDVRRAVVTAGLEARVHLLGVRDDVADLMAASDALVLSSRHEGLPNVVIEAMLARLPVVATAVGGSPELVDAPVTGLLVDAGDADALAAAMRKITDLDAEDRAAMGDAGRVRAEQLAGPDAVGAAWLALIARCQTTHDDPTAISRRASRRSPLPTPGSGRRPRASVADLKG